jgi:AraC family transcriptional regulator
MAPEGWTLEAEIGGADVWVGVSRRRAIDRIDRTHHADTPLISMWLSGRPQASRARFVAPAGQADFSSVGAVLAMPADTALQVLGENEPAGRMVHCRLPRAEGLGAAPAPAPASQVIDLRSPPIAACLRRLAKEASEPSFASAAIVEGLGLFMAAQLSIHLERLAIPAARGGLAPWQLRRINEHLHAGNWNCSVSDLAGLCGLSPSHTMRAFREATGRTIAQHVAELRLERARTLLADRALTIAEVGAVLQFAHPSAFTAAFRRVMGVTPRQFRQSELRATIAVVGRQSADPL